MKSCRGIGVMSGTSLDGIDLADCSFRRDEQPDRWSYEIHHAETLPYPTEWETLLSDLHRRSAEEYARTHVHYGRFLGERLAAFVSGNNLTPDFVASHGHTVFHQPEEHWTAQLGDGETTAAFLPCPLVANFRNKDVALGGQGAPLVPVGERELFSGCDLFLNLGGFANLTAGNTAFDVAPCNFVLNRLARQADPDVRYDRDGALARSGAFSAGLFDKFESLDYYRRPPPKSLGREWLDTELYPILDDANLSPVDVLHTFCRHVASQVEKAVANAGITDSTIAVTGGGAFNTFLCECLREVLGTRKISFREVDFQTIAFKEALIFAFLGLLVLRGEANTSARVTGARTDAVCGSIHLPPTAQAGPPGKADRTQGNLPG